MGKELLINMGASNAVAADSFSRTSLQGFFGECYLLWGFRLVPDIRSRRSIIPAEKLWGYFAAKIAICAGVVVEENSWEIERVFVIGISHGFESVDNGPMDGVPARL